MVLSEHGSSSTDTGCGSEDWVGYWIMLSEHGSMDTGLGGLGCAGIALGGDRSIEVLGGHGRAGVASPCGGVLVMRILGIGCR